MSSSTKAIYILSGTILLLLFVLYMKSCRDDPHRDDGIALVNSLNDTIKYYKNKDGENTATISAMQTEAANDFLTLQSKDGYVRELQGVVKDYANKLKAGNSVTLALLETINKGIQPTIITKIDTVEVDKEDGYGQINYLWPTYQDSVHDEWLDYKATINKDSAIRSIAVYNKFSAVIGKDKKGSFADITIYNPYSTVKVLRTYQVSQPRYKPFGLGFSTGITYWNGWKPYLGVGITYTPKWLKF